MLKKFLNNIEKYIIWVCFVPLIGLMFFQVVARYCFGLAWGWVEQVSRLLYIYVGFAGMSLVSVRREHLRVSFVAEMLPGKHTKTILYLIGDVTMTATCAFLFYLLTKMTILCSQQGQVFAGAPFIPVWVMYFAGMVGMFGIVIRTVMFSLVPAFKELFGRGQAVQQTADSGEAT